MKIFQIVNNICHYDATQIHPTLASTVGKYPNNITFVETPDYVFEGWGYDSGRMDESRFVRPTPPDGWDYDDTTGTFYQIGEKPQPSEIEQVRQQVSELQGQVSTLEADNAMLLYAVLSGGLPQ